MIIKTDLRGYWNTVVMIMTIIVIIGCSIPKRPPTEKMTDAELAIQVAQANQADDLAPLELRYAQDYLQQAKQALHHKAYEEAAWLAERALIDAQLAEAKAASKIAQQRVKTLQETIQTLRQEMTSR